MSYRFVRLAVTGVVGFAVISSAVGCSGALSAAKHGGKMAMRMMKKSNVRVSLDGYAAKESRFKKAVKGVSNWKVKEPISTNPTLRFRYVKPEKVTRTTSTIINIFKRLDSGYSDQPEFVIAPRDHKPESLLKPNTDYNLGQLPGHLKIMNLRGDKVEAVTLLAGTKYKLVLIIRADKSETVQVTFETK